MSVQNLNNSHHIGASIGSLKNRWRINLGGKIIKWRESQFSQDLIDNITFARRCVISSGIAHAAHGARRVEVVDWLKSENLWSHCTHWEQEYLAADRLRPSQLNEASWRIERLWLFAWAKGEFDVLDHKQKCGKGLAVYFPGPKDSCNDFLRVTKLRSSQEIIKERCQLAYLNEIFESKGVLPTGYDEGVVLERLHAINWLTRQVDQWPDSLWQ